MLKEKGWINNIKELKKIKIKANKNILKKELIEQIKKLCPKEKFGILFSGGVDSSFIAMICKQLKKDFICYTVGLENSEDIEYSKKAAHQLKLKLKIINLNLNSSEKLIEKTTKLLKTNDVTKVGVG